MSIGSSPRARGTHGGAESHAETGRFIPACAGNTQGPAPHLLAAAGSSPRARGTLQGKLVAGLQFRFIPACAGNTASRRTGLSIAPVHPRVRGEHQLTVHRAWSHSGSSPRARGTRVKVSSLMVVLRFIPACAGNTASSPSSPRLSSVHPRVRGEHSPNADQPGHLFGSSPRARGTPDVSWPQWPAQRFIPACAGNTRPTPVRLPLMAVHPRVRGEH